MTELGYESESLHTPCLCFTYAISVVYPMLILLMCDEIPVIIQQQNIKEVGLKKNNPCVQLLNSPVRSTTQCWEVLFISTVFVAYIFCVCV